MIWLFYTLSFKFKIFTFFCKHPVVSLRLLRILRIIRIIRIEICNEAVFFITGILTLTPKNQQSTTPYFFYTSSPHIYLSLPLFITFSLYAPLCLDDFVTTTKSIGHLSFKDAQSSGNDQQDSSNLRNSQKRSSVWRHSR